MESHSSEETPINRGCKWEITEIWGLFFFHQIVETILTKR